MRRLVALLAGLAAIASARLAQDVVRIGPNKRIEYIAKFGFARGTSTWRIRVKLKRHSAPGQMDEDRELTLHKFLDERWPDVLAESDLCKKAELAREDTSYTVKANGEFNDWVSGTLDQSVRPHIWYFMLSDCAQQLPNVTHRFAWEMEFLQPNGSHFSIEMWGMTTAHVINLLSFSAFMFVFFKRSREFVTSAGYLHPVIWFLLITMVIQYVGQLFHTIHLLNYGGNGLGVKALEVLGQIFSMMSQVCQTSLLILIGLGYTLLQSRIGELDIMIIMCFMIMVIHGMLVGLGKIQDDAHFKYHENEGAVGWILLVMRLLLWAWFLWACLSTADCGGRRLKEFMMKFAAVGSLYFLAYPAIFLVGGLFAPYLQHPMMTIGLMVMQMASNVWLAMLFLTRGEYFKVSTLSDSELPGGAKVGMTKEE